MRHRGRLLTVLVNIIVQRFTVSAEVGADSALDPEFLGFGE